MGHKSIGYHTRLENHNGTKLVGGCFGGAFDMETVNRLIKSQFTVIIKPSGTPVFVDKEGRQVTLYVTVDPFSTDAGKLAKAEYARERARLQETEEEKERQINDLMGSLSNDEIIRRLTE